MDWPDERGIRRNRVWFHISEPCVVLVLAQILSDDDTRNHGRSKMVRWSSKSGMELLVYTIQAPVVPIRLNGLFEIADNQCWIS
jgi:hypothetical protein